MTLCYVNGVHGDFASNLAYGPFSRMSKILDIISARSCGDARRGQPLPPEYKHATTKKTLAVGVIDIESD